MSDPAGAQPGPATSAAPSLGSQLCTQCGLCCNGVIHTTAKLDPDEVQSAAALGLPVQPGEKPSFKLPCPHLENACCTIYGSRPRVCARYKCQLLQDLESGAVPLDEAEAKVRLARELLAKVESAMPQDMTIHDTKAIALASVPATGAGAAESVRQSMRLKLHATALYLFMDRHFRNSKDGQLFELNAIPDQRSETEMG